MVEVLTDAAERPRQASIRKLLEFENVTLRFTPMGRFEAVAKSSPRSENRRPGACAPIIEEL